MPILIWWFHKWKRNKLKLAEINYLEQKGRDEAITGDNIRKQYDTISLLKSETAKLQEEKEQLALLKNARKQLYESQVAKNIQQSIFTSDTSAESAYAK